MSLMGVTAAPRRVMIAVEPRLLADSLLRALSRPELDVVIHLDPPAPSEGTHFDAAVVTDRLPDGVRADVVVRLSPTGLGAGSVTTVRGTETAALGDLTGLLETLHRFLR